MTAEPSPDILTGIWAIKDALSASQGHDLKATCRALYAEQRKHPELYVNLGKNPAGKKQERSAGRADGKALSQAVAAKLK